MLASIEKETGAFGRKRVRAEGWREGGRNEEEEDDDEEEEEKKEEV